jgi:hypothetical protein
MSEHKQQDGKYSWARGDSVHTLGDNALMLSRNSQVLMTPCTPSISIVPLVTFPHRPSRMSMTLDLNLDLNLASHLQNHQYLPLHRRQQRRIPWVPLHCILSQPSPKSPLHPCPVLQCTLTLINLVVCLNPRKFETKLHIFGRCGKIFSELIWDNTC